MKTVTFDKIEVVGDKVTITGTVVEKDFTQRTQQQTVHDIPKSNPDWIRHVQISNQAVFVKRFGQKSFAIDNCNFTKLAESVEPDLLPPPPSAPKVAPNKRPPVKPAPAVVEPIPA